MKGLQSLQGFGYEEWKVGYKSELHEGLCGSADFCFCDLVCGRCNGNQKMDNTSFLIA